MLPDQSRFILTGDYEADMKLLQERLDRTPVFEPQYEIYTGLAGSIASSTIEVVDGTSSFTYFKDESWTDIEVLIFFTVYLASGVDSRCDVGIRIDGTDYPNIAHITLAAASNNHYLGAGIYTISGLAAGEHTLQPVWELGAGAGTFTGDGNDYLHVRVLEVLPPTT